jgi:hypothetical protein
VNAQALLGEHISGTYLRLRRGMALIALFFPWALWFGGLAASGTTLQASMSAYYYTDMRDVFVGVLVAIGAFLFLYKGYTAREDWALNIAGACAPGIAFFAMNPDGDCSASSGGFSAHGAFAVVFFGAIAYVCIFLSEEGPVDGVPARLRQAYCTVAKACGGVMVVCIGGAVAYTFLASGEVMASLCEANLVFWLEALAVGAFSVYWIVKSLEYDHVVSWLPWREAPSRP